MGIQDRNWRPCRLAETRRGVRTVICLAVLYVLAILAARLFCMDDHGYTSVWPANGIMLAGCLLLRGRLFLGLLGACTLGYMLISPMNGADFVETAIGAVLNALQVWIAALLTRRFCGATSDLLRPVRFVRFALIACIASLFESGAGVAIGHLLLTDWAPFLTWMQWALCDALGLMMTTPLVIHVLRKGMAPNGKDRAGLALGRDVAVLVPGSIMLAVLSFMLPTPAFFLFVFPALALLAFRVQAFWVYLVISAVSGIASAMTARGFGPIAHLSPDGHLLREAMLQPYLLALFLVVLPVNSMVLETRRASARLMLTRARLEHLATYDTLTGAMNRGFFEKALQARLNRGERGAILFLDIDHFKVINDASGHPGGDLILRDFCRRVCGCITGKAGLVGRIGGDEFAAFVPGMRSMTEIRAFCSQLLVTLRAPYQCGGLARVVTASIGVAQGEGDTLSIGRLLARADAALYNAKASGRDGFSIYGQADRQPGPERSPDSQVWAELVY